MTFWWDYHWCFIVGSIVALVGDHLSRKRNIPARRVFAAGLLLVLLVFVPAVIWLYYFVSSAWMLNYFISKQAVGDFVIVLFVLYPIFYLVGYFVTRRLNERESKQAAYLYAIFLIWWIVFTVLIYNRFYFISDSTANWQNGAGEWFWEKTGTAPLLFFDIPLGPLFKLQYWGSMAMFAVLSIYAAWVVKTNNGRTPFTGRTVKS
jgi:magnesium-transporting ATPase (P-type)